jgi:hypothetical protein
VSSGARRIGLQSSAGSAVEGSRGARKAFVRLFGGCSACERKS